MSQPEGCLQAPNTACGAAIWVQTLPAGLPLDGPQVRLSWPLGSRWLLWGWPEAAWGPSLSRAEVARDWDEGQTPRPERRP